MKSKSVVGKSRAKKKKTDSAKVCSITISRDPGCRTKAIVGLLTQKTEFTVFHRELIHEMAKNSDINEQLFKTLDEKKSSIIEEWISTLTTTSHLWPDQYLQQLMKVVSAIGTHGQNIIVGRGANFILPANRQLSVRLTAPLDTRIQNVAKDQGIPEKEAKLRVLRTEAHRKGFIKTYFYADISDPLHYDLTLNTKNLSVESCADIIATAVKRKFP